MKARRRAPERAFAPEQRGRGVFGPHRRAVEHDERRGRAPGVRVDVARERFEVATHLGSVRTLRGLCYVLPMEVTGVIKDGKVVLPASVKLPDGAKVRVVFDAAQGGTGTPLEREALAWDDVEADLRIAKGFDSASDHRCRYGADSASFLGRSVFLGAPTGAACLLSQFSPRLSWEPSSSLYRRSLSSSVVRGRPSRRAASLLLPPARARA